MYYTIQVRVSEDTKKLVEKLAKESGLSEREVLAYSSEPCSPCSEFVVPYQCKNIKIPRGILFNDLLTKHASYKRHTNE